MPFSLWEAVTTSTTLVLITFRVECRTRAAKCFGNNLHILRHIPKHVQEREQAFLSLAPSYTRELFLLGWSPFQQGHLAAAACPDAGVPHEQGAATPPPKNGLPIVLVESQVLHSPSGPEHSLSKAAEIPKGCTSWDGTRL